MKMVAEGRGHSRAFGCRIEEADFGCRTSTILSGRKAGSLQNYGYSSAMKGADFVWDKEKLDRFIAKPDEVVPGNNMKPYGGLTSAEDRAKVIAFLESPTTN